jgi:putative membrane protein
MMYGWWNGFAGPGYGMLFGPIFMVVFVVLTLVITAWLLRALGPGSQRKSSLDILRERFARGEIDQREYEERKKLLSA